MYTKNYPVQNWKTIVNGRYESYWPLEWGQCCTKQGIFRGRIESGCSPALAKENRVVSEGRERELGDDGCFVNGNFDALVTCAPSIAVLRIEIN